MNEGMDSITLLMSLIAGCPRGGSENPTREIRQCICLLDTVCKCYPVMYKQIDIVYRASNHVSYRHFFYVTSCSNFPSQGSSPRFLVA